VGTDSPALAGTLVDLRPRTLLHFLGLTGKTGRLHAHQNLHHAAVWLRDGDVVAVDHDPLDSAVEMLRMANGDFGFDEVRPPGAEDAVGIPVAILLERATGQLAEWEEAAQAVPSMSLVIELCRCDAEVRLSADAWNVSMVVASGEATPQQVAAHLRWDPLRTCRAVKELVDAGRADLLPPVRAPVARFAESVDVAVAVAGTGSAQPLWPGAGAEWRTPWYDPGD
jgi:uncharacterized protein DUF4388